MQVDARAAGGTFPEAVEDMLGSCDGLDHIIHNLEALASVLGGEETPKGPVLVAPVVSEALERTRTCAATHGVPLELGGVDSGVRATAHREKLDRALHNLIRNAIQYSPVRQPVRVHVLTRGKHCSVRIEDAGPRLTEEWKDLAFLAQGQSAAKNTSAGRYGRGLGLFCARVCAEAAGGKIRIGEISDGTSGNALELTLPVYEETPSSGPPEGAS
jgi:two-component system OmpR family sensor kinase